MATPNGEPTKTIELLEQVRRTSRWERRLLVVLAVWAVVVNTAAVGFMAWNTWRVRQIGQGNHDFAKAHAEASYQRAITTIHVIQCQDEFFYRALIGQAPGTLEDLQACFSQKVTAPMVKVPLKKEHDGRLKGGP